MTRANRFDYRRYMEALAAFQMTPAPLPGNTAKLAKWRWPPLGPYNGFSGEQRVRIWQLQAWAQKTGALSRPKSCSICDSGSHVGFHCESYADPWSPIPLCQACHQMVHRRFREPEAWGEFQARHHRVGAIQWLDLLPATPIDLAGWLNRT